VWEPGIAIWGEGVRAGRGASTAASCGFVGRVSSVRPGLFRRVGLRECAPDWIGAAAMMLR
jgi:hypothetical protein